MQKRRRLFSRLRRSFHRKSPFRVKSDAATQAGVHKANFDSDNDLMQLLIHIHVRHEFPASFFGIFMDYTTQGTACQGGLPEKSAAKRQNLLSAFFLPCARMKDMPFRNNVDGCLCEISARGACSRGVRKGKDAHDARKSHSSLWI